MVFIATVLGTIIAFPLFLIASRNVVVHPYIYQPVRFLVDFIRTIPTYILAILCTVFFGLGETAGIWAMAIFTLGIMFKLMYEYIDTCDMNPFEASISTGATRMKAFNVALMPEVKPMFFSNFIYTFELNIRASVILGFVGAGGIGQMLSNAMIYFKNSWYNVIAMLKEQGITYYVNLASPYINDRGTIKYIDYDLDMKLYPSNQIKIIDVKEYGFHRKKYQYSDDIDSILRFNLKEIKSIMISRVFPFNDKKIREYYDEFLSKINKEGKYGI